MGNEKRVQHCRWDPQCHVLMSPVELHCWMELMAGPPCQATFCEQLAIILQSANTFNQAFDLLRPSQLPVFPATIP